MLEFLIKKKLESQYRTPKHLDAILNQNRPAKHANVSLTQTGLKVH